MILLPKQVPDRIGPHPDNIYARYGMAVIFQFAAVPAAEPNTVMLVPFQYLYVLAVLLYHLAPSCFAPIHSY